MLLLLIPFVLTLLITTYAILRIDEDEKEIRMCFAFLIFIMWFQALFFSISFGQLKWTPHNNLSQNISDITEKLLNCAVQKIPQLQKAWELVKNCTHDAQVYHVPKTKVPLAGSIPTAFVTPRIFSNAVFVVNSEYDLLTNTKKALVFIHECTHLVLNTVDHAYSWQPKFDTLSPKKQLENADSYVDLILNICVNDIYVF